MAGYTINQLPTLSAASSGDQLPVFVSSEGSAYKMSLNTLLTWLRDTFTSPDVTVVTAAPSSSGFTVTLDDTSDNLWLILSPTGNFASGTVTLPAVADLADGQTIMITVNSTYVSALTIAGNGATVTGEPTGLENSTMVLRYNLATTTWFCQSGGDVFPSAAIESLSTNTILSGSGLTVTSSDALYMSAVGLLSLTATTYLDLQAPHWRCLTTTVAALPAAATAGAGARAFVTNNNGTTFGNNVVAGGTDKVPVYCDGTNWKVG